ncbi:helix-turn-helix transcriptional regulator [Aquabacterium sp.]|uniref:helix-turn-helix transcriptional regulator n=1 Tax=Aquabacterium sp. TaxID=1872578 RepID=UPI003784D079
MQLVSNGAPVVQRDQYLRLPQVEQITGLKKSTIYLLMRRGEFPNAVKITARCTAWPASRVYEWVQDVKDRASAAEPQRGLSGFESRA